MGTRERREREREARRRAVLDAARALLRERGIGGTTTRQIAERCELSEATLFWYFRSKDEIFTSLLLESIDDVVQGIAGIVEARGSFEQKLSRLWAYFADVRERHPDYFQLFAYLSQPEATAGASSELRAEIARRSGQPFRSIAGLFAEVAGPEDARLRADLFWATCVGMVVLRDARQNLNLGDQVHPNDAEFRRSLRLVVDGIAAKRPKKRGGDR